MRRAAVPLLLAALLLPAAARAAEFTYCVNSVASFENAFTVASSNAPGIDRVVIQVVQGIYDLSASSLLSDNGFRKGLGREVEVLGGFLAGCSGRVLNPTNTRLLNSQPARELLWEPISNFRMSGFHFDNFASRISLDPFTVNPIAQSIEISHLRITGGSGQVVLGADAGAGTSTLQVKNVLVWNRNAGGGAGCGMLLVGDDEASTTVRAVVANLTIAANSGNGLCLQQIDQPELYNVISCGNSSVDLIRSSGAGNGALVAYHNIFGSQQNISYAVNTANLNADPQFQNLLTGDLRLQNGSPGINSGYISVPFGPGAVDVAGLTRSVGLAIDRGAHESLNTGLFALTVTSTADSGPNTLRNAIEQANATPGPNAILFNFGGSGCPRVIELDSQLPAIIETLVIDGSSQPGFVASTSTFSDNGTRCVALVNASGPAVAFGLLVGASADAGARLSVDSLAFGGFAGAAVYLNGGSAHRIIGSRFGGSQGSLSLPASARGVWIVGPNDVEIGGDGPRERNLFAGITGSSNPPSVNAAVLVGSSSQRVQVLGNFIGESGGGNRYGVVSAGSDGLIAGNVIGFSTEAALELQPGANNHLIERNRIGLPPICLLPPCSSAGNAAGMRIGSQFNVLNANLSANSQDGPGLRVTGNDNSIYAHLAYAGSSAFAPIDIGGSGFSVNGNNGASNPPDGNRGQNHPVLNSAQREGSNLIVRGQLDSANGDYLVQLYVSERRLLVLSPPQVRCEGRRLLASGSATIGNAPAGANGSASFAISLSPQLQAQGAGGWLTALASKRITVNGEVRYGDSSEYGNCLELPLFSDGFEEAP
jgi:hypothetical protein